jgi:hypothetical protein
MKKIILLLNFLWLIPIGYSQPMDTVIVFTDDFNSFKINPADSLREEGDVKGAIKLFRKIYEKEGDKSTEIYNYACALSVDKQVDSAFKYLSITTKVDTSLALFALCDPDFMNLRTNKKWDTFEAGLIAMVQYQSHNTIKDIDYAKKLWFMHAKDQAYYDCLRTVENKIGPTSTVALALWDLKESLNLENQQELEKLIATKGWPKISQVGDRAAGAAFLIIQHSDVEKQKQYLPTIQKLCETHEASWQDYALMFDRIQVSENKPQKYGSQIRYNQFTDTYELLPLIDESKVDEWRKEVGLGPLSDYVMQWGITFQPKKK